MTTTQITTTKLHRDSGAVLDAVLSGQVIEIVRRGRIVAILVPPSMGELIASADTQKDTK